MFLEHVVGFVPKYIIPYGKKLSECVELDNAIGTVDVLVECCKYIIDNSKIDEVTKQYFTAVYLDIDGYSDYLKRNPNENEEDVFQSINLVLEEFYEACDMSRIKLA